MKINRHCALAVIPFLSLLSVSIPGAFAATQSDSSGRTSSYHLAPGDVLHLQVMTVGLDSLSGDLPVQSDGRVTLPTRPPEAVMAAGLTITQFQEAAQAAFRHYLRYPQVLVTLRSPHVDFVYLVGYFARDGAYPLGGESSSLANASANSAAVSAPGAFTALDAVALAGGAPEGDLSQVVLTRGRTTRVLNLDEAQRANDPRDNIQLLPNDVIFVPESRQHVTVQGQVNAPHNIPFKAGMELEEAIGDVGGVTAKADVSHVKVTHANGKELTIDLQKLIQTGAKDNIALQAGDIVTVPELLDRVLVLGEVRNPQTIPYKESLTVDDAIALSGGETPRADLSHVKLAHMDPASIQTIDLDRARREGSATQIKLKPGDVITVPTMDAQVFVLGSVTHPGPVPFRPGMTLLEALSGSAPETSRTAASVSAGASAGGPTTDADLYDAILTHADGTTVPVDLDKLIRKGDQQLNMKLAAGDSLYLPESKRVVYVFGAVNKPGAYYLSQNDKDRVLNALDMAAGSSPGADIGKAKLLRRSPDGKIVTTDLHLDKMLNKGQLQDNVQLLPGDVIFVPQQSRQPGISAGNLLPSLIYTLVPFLRP